MPVVHPRHASATEREHHGDGWGLMLPLRHRPSASGKVSAGTRGVSRFLNSRTAFQLCRNLTPK